MDADCEPGRGRARRQPPRVRRVDLGCLSTWPGTPSVGKTVCCLQQVWVHRQPHSPSLLLCTVLFTVTFIVSRTKFTNNVIQRLKLTHYVEPYLHKKNLTVLWETSLWSLDPEDLLEKEMATHSSILAWKISWTEEPGGLQSRGSQRVSTTEWLTIT